MIENTFQTDPISQILGRLYQGNLYGADQLRFSNPHNVTTIINCTKDQIPPIKGIKQLVLGLEDGEAIKPRDLDMALIWIRREIFHNGSVMVCCHAGISRSTVIVASYLYSIGMDWDEAIEHIKNKRPIVVPHPELVVSVKKHFRIFPYNMY